MWSVTIERVDIKRSIPDKIAALSLDSPRPGDVILRPSLSIAGWVLGMNEPVRTVLVSSDMTDQLQIPVTKARPDVCKKFSKQYPWAANTGFSSALPFYHQTGPVDFTLTLQLENEVIEACQIRATIKIDSHIIQPRFTPILLTSLGRTGTTFSMQLLSHHSDIVANRVYPYETKIAQHYLKSLQDFLAFSNIDRLSPELVEYFYRQLTRRTAQHYIASIDEFYSALARSNGQPQARYFVEKFLPFQYEGWLDAIYSDVKEIILVRDFRDMLASILAFNSKRGNHGFNRSSFESDVEYARSQKTAADRLRQAWEKRSDRALLVKYEDLILNDEVTLKRIFEYLEVDSSPALVREICDLGRQQTTYSERHITSRSRAASIGRWRQELSPELIAASHDAFGEALDVFGYEV